MSSAVRSAGWPPIKRVLPKPSEGLKTGKADAETGLSDSDWHVIQVVCLIAFSIGAGVVAVGLIGNGLGWW